MVETAARLTDHVFPRLPVRQWVLSVPIMQRDGAVLNMVLHIGAVAFIHRFGSSLGQRKVRSVRQEHGHRPRVV